MIKIPFVCEEVYYSGLYTETKSYRNDVKQIVLDEPCFSKKIDYQPKKENHTPATVSRMLPIVVTNYLPLIIGHVANTLTTGKVEYLLRQNRCVASTEYFVYTFFSISLFSSPTECVHWI